MVNFFNPINTDFRKKSSTSMMYRIFNFHCLTFEKKKINIDKLFPRTASPSFFIQIILVMINMIIIKSFFVIIVIRNPNITMADTIKIITVIISAETNVHYGSKIIRYTATATIYLNIFNFFFSKYLGSILLTKS